MKILTVHIDGFGKFVNRDFAFGEDINLIRGQNEAGKTTLHTFFEAMLLGPSRKPKGFTKSPYEAMEPWDEQAPYKGSMRIESEGCIYRIERDFARGQESLRIVCEDTGEELQEPEQFLKTAMEGMTPEAFRNSISVGQLSARTGAALKKELSSYMNNMASTANPELNAERAAEYLETRLEELHGRIREDAAREYTATLSRIKNIENDLDRPENENRIRYFELQRDKTEHEITEQKKQIEECEDRIREATEILEDHRIRSAADIKLMEEKAQSLYNDYLWAVKRSRSVLRIGGMVLAGLVLAASAAAYLLRGKLSLTFPPVCYAVAAAQALVLLVILAIVQNSANRRRKDAEQIVLAYMEPRIGDGAVNEDRMEELIRFIHGYDGMLEDREKERKQKNRLEDEIAALRNREAEIEEKLAEQQVVLSRVEDRMAEENRLRGLAAQLRQTVAENRRMKEETDAIEIAIDTIHNLSDTIRTRLGTYLNNEASRVLNDLTGGHYRSMDVGNINDISLNSSDGMISVNDVSAGTADQVYLAVRIAAARFMMQGKDSLPLIFDDSFAFFDDERLKSAVSYVASDYRGQIFIFSCHRREEEVLAETGRCRILEL